MPLPLLAAQGIMAGIGALGGLLGNRRQQQQQTQRSTSQQNSNINTYNRGFSTGRSNPVYDEAAWNYRNQLMGDLQRAYNQPLADPNAAARSLTTQQLWNSGQQGDILKKQLQQAYASQGLNYGAMGTAPQAQANADTIMQRAQILNNQPLLARQFEQENEQIRQGRAGQLMQMFGMIPYGQEQSQETYNHGTQLGETTGIQDSVGTMTNPGNMAAGGLLGLGQGLGSMFGTLYGNQWSPQGGGYNYNYLPQMYRPGGYQYMLP